MKIISVLLFCLLSHVLSNDIEIPYLQLVSHRVAPGKIEYFWFSMKAMSPNTKFNIEQNANIVGPHFAYLSFESRPNSTHVDQRLWGYQNEILNPRPGRFDEKYPLKVTKGVYLYLSIADGIVPSTIGVSVHRQSSKVTLLYNKETLGVPTERFASRIEIDSGIPFYREINQTLRAEYSFLSKTEDLTLDFFIELKIRFIDSAVVGKVPSKMTRYDYYGSHAAVIDNEPVEGYVRSRGGDPVDFYANVARLNDPISLPDSTAHQFKSEGIVDRHGTFWGSFLSLPPSRDIIRKTRIAVTGETQGQNYVLSPFSNDYRMGFGNLHMMKLGRKRLSLKVGGFGPFKMDFRIELQNSNRVDFVSKEWWTR